MADTHITIPIPRPTQNVHRGYKEKEPAPKSYPRSIRFTFDDYILVHKVAATLGMSFSEFTKWTAFYSAVEVINKMEAAKQSKYKKLIPNELDTEGYE